MDIYIYVVQPWIFIYDVYLQQRDMYVTQFAYMIKDLFNVGNGLRVLLLNRINYLFRLNIIAFHFLAMSIKKNNINE